MKRVYQKICSGLLAVSLLSALVVPAAASDALGADLTAKDTVLNHETRLSTNVFWSSTFSDLRTENLITYVPNEQVHPVVTYGEAVTSKSTVSAMAGQLEKQGYRVVAGINGDFYNLGNGLPIGAVVTDGIIRSSDAGYYAIGFREDGTAVLGKPSMKITANLGYYADDGMGGSLEFTRPVFGINKARVSAGGIYLYTHDFNEKHTTGTTEPGVNVVCSVADGTLSMGSTLTLKAEKVVETAQAIPIGKNQMVLSVNTKSDAYHVNALKNVPEGAEITIKVTAADERWNDVDYAVGALYSLVENGAIVQGLQAGSNPRTAVGQKADGTLIFYTIDGRKAGHSIGASMKQVAARMLELGCNTVLCLDGGGSTALAVTQPDSTKVSVINRPSTGGHERAVTNQLFLIADNTPSGQLSHFYVRPQNEYVLAGSSVKIAASAVDTNYIPMEQSCELWASDGTIEGQILTTPTSGGDITVTAEGGGKQGVATVHVIATPDAVGIRNSKDQFISELHVSPGSETALIGSAAYSHLRLKADPVSFTWTVTGNIGTIDKNGVFTATAPGSGQITASAGGVSATIPVVVSKSALKTVEDFEGKRNIFSDNITENATVNITKSSGFVQRGHQSAAISYTLAENDEGILTSRVYASAPLDGHYTTLNFWVYGDDSDNKLNVLYESELEGTVKQEAAVLNFEGWKQLTIPVWSTTKLLGFEISGGYPITYETENGELISRDTAAKQSGTIYIDQIVSSFAGTVDQQSPSVALKYSEETGLSAKISDGVDGILPATSIKVSYDGTPITFHYNDRAGNMIIDLPLADGQAHRVTVTAMDASGNIGRASYDVEAGPDWKPHFTDTEKYWGATFVDYLYTANITTGYQDGTFKPNQKITRAQFAVMLYRYLKLDESKYADVQLTFADNDRIPQYAVPAIKALYTEGIINGSAGKDGKLYFNPGNSLTRAQAASMIGRTQAKGYPAAELSFADAEKIPAYARPFISTMTAQGIIGGYQDGTFRPNDHITRGQMAKILYNLM